MGKQRGQFSARRCILGLACAALLGGAAIRAADDATKPATTTSPAATAPLTTRIGKIRGDKAALDAMTRGAKFLLAQQKNANWERQPKRGDETHDGGETALVLWTLLHVGECLDDESLRADSPELKEAVAKLLQIDPKTTYVAAMQALAISKLSLMGNPEATKAAERARAFLVRAAHANGGYGYNVGSKFEDNSNTAAAIQGLGALQLEGIETPGAFWAQADEYWHTAQHKDGGWSYDEGARRNSTAGMTATAVASLYLTSAFRENKISATLPAGEKPKLPANVRDVAVSNGLTFLAAEFQPASRDYFFLYHLQRAISGAGLLTLGKKEVIAATAEAIAKAQKPDGSWQAEFSDPTIAGDQSLVSTCYAMLTLAEGFEPIGFSKLDYGSGSDERPRDVANLTMWMTTQLPRPMRWQLISESTPEASDFASPVVVITAAREFKLSDALQTRLRNFVRAGGMIVSIEEKPADIEKENAADAEKEKKDKSDKSATLPATRPPVRSALTEAITTRIARGVLQEEKQFRPLPAGHPLTDLWGKLNPSPQILAMSNGVRELWVHIPYDAGASWQNRRFSDKESFSLALNIYSYATGKGEMLALDPIPAALATAPQTQERAVSVARVIAGVNPDPEPKAWARFALESEKLFHTRVGAMPTRAADLNPAQMPIAHWVIATKEKALTKQEMESIAAYVSSGGLLVVEAAGGNTDYAEAARETLGKIFPDDKLELIPRNDLLFNGAMKDSTKIKEPQYRRFAATTRPMEVAPRLRGFTRGGRWAVVFSEDDLSAGLLGINTWGISGYNVRDARRIMGNLILYSLKPLVPASTDPATKTP